ncbi:MAG: chitobiase/beta-hexosaminidase C-terminal domain-containing protein, partial [Gemmataceae bacterium]
ALAWKGNDLWVANSPDLTIVRDLDGDDVADEYVLVYTDLGNLEHALHGLNWGPDGMLYMSKGNSKGLTQPGRIAPKPFRDLWGVKAPPDAPDLPPLKTFKPNEYKRAYHNPADDWGRTGGVLRCGDLGKHLEIVSRGLRNPWDISFDDGFNFLGTDNDQTGGDKLFAPFPGAHFGWGHGWSYDWLGEQHPPTAPASGPLFEGSGTGVVYYSAAHFPADRRGVFLVADWLRQRVDIYRPEWHGARLLPAGGNVEPFVSKGKSLFRPTDIEVAPDGTLYILGWGPGYGATFDKNGEHSDQGRVYRIAAAGQPFLDWNSAKRQKKLAAWTFAELAEDLGSHIPVWRVNAQAELLRRGPAIKKDLLELLGGELPRAQETWALWTLGRLSLADRSIDDYFAKLAGAGALDRRLQALRILAQRVRARGKPGELPDTVSAALLDKEARVRFEAVLALRQAGQKQQVKHLLELAARETDRVTFYACWGALLELMSVEELRPLLKDARGGVRRAALLALAEQGELKRDDAAPMRLDEDPITASVAELWLGNHGQKLPPLVSIEPPGTDFAESVDVTVKAGLDGAAIHYTLDGQVPTASSPVYRGPLALDKDATLTALLFRDGKRVGPLASARFRRLTEDELRRRLIYNLQSVSKNRYQVVERGLAKGARVYTDRTYKLTEVPAELAGATYIMTANADENARGEKLLTFELTRAATLFLARDTRTDTTPAWMKVGQPGGFQETNLVLATNDHKMKLYRKEFQPGPIVLGGAEARSNYLVVARRPALKVLAKKTEFADVLAHLPRGDAQRGASLFFDADGVGCYRCHRIDNLGNAVAPNLADVGQRAKPEEILRSILEPNALIVEGFRTHIFETAAGKVHTGTVLT